MLLVAVAELEVSGLGEATSFCFLVCGPSTLSPFCSFVLFRLVADFATGLTGLSNLMNLYLEQRPALGNFWRRFRMVGFE